VGKLVDKVSRHVGVARAVCRDALAKVPIGPTQVSGVYAGRTHRVDLGRERNRAAAVLACKGLWWGKLLEPVKPVTRALPAPLLR